MDQADTDTNEQYINAFRVLLAAAAFAFLIAAGAGVWIVLSISRGLAKAGALSDAVAIGDLGPVRSRSRAMTRSRIWSRRSTP